MDDRAKWLAVGVAGLAIVAVCFATIQMPATPGDVASPSPGQTEVATTSVVSRSEDVPAEAVTQLVCETTVIGESVEGRPIHCREVGTGDFVILFLASIHGNEAAGTPLVQRLIDEVIAAPALIEGRRLVVIPVVNPDGVAAVARYNARGVDLNRNFPAENRQNTRRYGSEALSEPEALAVYRTMERVLPQRIITLHQPLQCIDYDGPASELARAMSEQSPLPVKKLGSRPGSLGAYAGETLQIPTITFELPPNAASQPPELLWRFYGPALFAAIEHGSDSIAAEQPVPRETP